MINGSSQSMVPELDTLRMSLTKRDAQLNLMLAAVRSAVESGFERPTHTLLYGPPASFKTTALLALAAELKRLHGDDAVLVLDGPSTTKAGSEKTLLDAENVPQFICIEELEKVAPKHLHWLLGVMDNRSEVNVTNGRRREARTVKALVLATANDKRKLDGLLSGALSSRFSNPVFFPAPTKDEIRELVEAWIEKSGGDRCWVRPAVEYCDKTEAILDPRRVLAICQLGRDGLLDGSFQSTLRATSANALPPSPVIDEARPEQMVLDGVSTNQVPPAGEPAAPVDDQPISQVEKDVALGNIVGRAKRLLAEAEVLERDRDHADLQARRKRIEVALLVRQAARLGAKLTKLYADLGIHRKYGPAYLALAELYEEVGEAGINERQAGKGLLSLNQATTLLHAVNSLSNPEEAKRLVLDVRDKANLTEPSFGPENIRRMAGLMSKPKNDLRKQLEIEQSRIDELRQTAPELVKYEAQILGNEIIIRAPSLPLAFASLTVSPEQASKALEFFAKGGEFVIRRKGA